MAEAVENVLELSSGRWRHEGSATVASVTTEVWGSEALPLSFGSSCFARKNAAGVQHVTLKFWINTTTRCCKTGQQRVDANPHRYRCDKCRSFVPAAAHSPIVVYGPSGSGKDKHEYVTEAGLHRVIADWLDHRGPLEAELAASDALQDVQYLLERGRQIFLPSAANYADW